MTVCRQPETASRTVPCDRGLRIADLDADALGDVRGSQGAGDGLTDGAERALVVLPIA